MDLEPEDVAKFSAALDKWMRTIESSKGTPHNSMGNATITVNAGGIGVWIAVTCSLVMLSMLVLGSLWATHEFLRYDQEMQARKDENGKMLTYLSAIYAQAPQFKPKDESTKKE